ncbi:MAG: endolytic transglycosylase MltG [Tumebacillaceae bacterium]
MRKRNWWYIAALVVLVVLGGTGLYVRSQLQPPTGSGKAVAIEVPKGASAYTIGQQLTDAGMIKSARFFKWYVSYQGQTSQLKAGMFQLRQGMTFEEIAHVLVSGGQTANTVTFTIPEGLTLEQMGDLLQKDHVVDKQAFLKEADTGAFDYEFVKAIPATKGEKHRLEGYLFPDTYEVFKNATAHQIIDTMLKQMNTTLTPDMLATMKKNGQSVHQMLTVASLVEREARVDTERPVIAGVIHNRLAAEPPMKLQIDATVDYALGKTKETLLYSDLEVDSPYNTYKYDGLPPGPIAAPGLKSIAAAIDPAKHDFYFYVTKSDGSGEHYFAKTYPEHQQNIAKSDENAKKQASGS